MIDEPSQPTCATQLRWSLQALAQAGSVQPPLFPEQAFTADELASRFERWSSACTGPEGTGLSDAQESSLGGISRKLATMSQDGAEFDADLWTDAALRTSEHWSDIRRLAAAALEAFGWDVVGSPVETADGSGQRQDGDDPG